MEAGRSDGSVCSTEYNEKSLLLGASEIKPRKPWLYPQRMSEGIFAIIGVLATPFVYTGQCLIACFYYGEDGRFSLLAPAYNVAHMLTRSRRKAKTQPRRMSSTEKQKRRVSVKKPGTRSLSIASTSTAITSDSESERHPATSRHTRSMSNASSGGDEIAPARRSIRIKLHNEDALRQRKRAQAKTNAVSPEAAASLKSPTGPMAVASKQLTKFPRTPLPPRPLVPRRQPSYSGSGQSAIGPHQKTLIIDL